MCRASCLLVRGVVCLTSDLTVPLPLFSPLQAAAHIHRYLTLDESILLESSADSAKGTCI